MFRQRRVYATGSIVHSGAMTSASRLLFDNSYARLPERFFSRHDPVPVASPGLVRVNRALATYLGIDPDWLASDQGVATIAGNRVPEGASPIATVYAGHQFGHWNPQLGDGRALLLGEVIAADGVRHDVQLKGSGQTRYSRNGDGRAPIGPVLREYIVSEAMFALGIPTTRSLAAVTTGEPVFRNEPEPGGVLARVAKSHIRIGTVQFFASCGDREGLEALVDHVIARHYPNAAEVDNPRLALLEGVIERTAELVARWQLVGFIHGVMNTDNMLLSGETIDYGPCAFMDAFDYQTVFSSIDHGGRYAYGNQPAIAQWNLACLAQALLPILDEDEDKAVEAAQAAITRYPALFEAAYRAGMRDKLGLVSEDDGDAQLFRDFFDLMHAEHVDFTLAFRRLADLAGPEDEERAQVDGLIELPEAFAPWLERWRARLAQESTSAFERQRAMDKNNPVLIPRNHLVEQAIDAAVSHRDFEPFHELVDALRDPFAYEPELERFATPPLPEQVVRATF